MRKSIVLGLAVALSGCQFLPGTDAHKIRAAEELVSAGLNDPSSAQYRMQHVTADGSYVCGEVNGRNKYGGYAGFNLFAFNNATKEALFFPNDISEEGASSQAIAFPKDCLNKASAGVVENLKAIEKNQDKVADEMEAQADRLDKMADEVSNSVSAELR